MLKTLLVIVGPTGVGKTEYVLRLAERIGCPIVNADSRQIYKEIPIGTAAPTAEEQARVPHYFVGTRSVCDDYSAGQYERDCLALLDELRQRPDATEPFAILTGGSMMYIDAVCKGLDDIPSVSAEVRAEVQQSYREGGLAWLQAEVARIDPDYWAVVDPQNPQRLMHCVEVTRAAGKPYSLFRQKDQTGARVERPFKIEKIGLERPREELYARINRRVDAMLAAGLEEEARRVYPLRAHNSLQTVGYRELFAYFDGKISREEAIRLIKQNSRHYAKRQMTWFRADQDIRWINPDSGSL